MRPFLAALAVTLVVGVGVFFGFFFRPQIIFTVTPADATVTIDGATVSGRRTVAVMPGRHEIVITKDGFVPYKKAGGFGVAERRRLTITLLPVPEAKALTDEPVVLAGLATDRQSVLFVGNDGRTLFSLNDDEQKVLTPNSFANPVFFRMSPTQDVAILKNPNGELFLHDFKRYDLVSQQQFLYGRDIGAIDWIYPSGTTLLYAYAPGDGERSLIVADRTNTDLERVLNLGAAGIVDPTISVAPDGKTAVLVSRPGQEFSSYNMFLFDMTLKKATQLTTDGSKIDARFSPSGRRILYTRFEQDPNGFNNQLISIMDADGKNRKDFNLRATLDQVAFLDENRLVVAATEKGGDVLFRLDLISGLTTKYYVTTPAGLRITHVAVAADGKMLYAIGTDNPREKRGTLYMIHLATDEYE
jgi:hypothetical protein